MIFQKDFIWILGNSTVFKTFFRFSEKNSDFRRFCFGPFPIGNFKILIVSRSYYVRSKHYMIFQRDFIYLRQSIIKFEAGFVTGSNGSVDQDLQNIVNLSMTIMGGFR